MNLELLYHVNLGNLTRHNTIIDFTNNIAKWGEYTKRYIRRNNGYWQFSSSETKDVGLGYWVNFNKDGATFEAWEIEKAYKLYLKDQK